MKRVILVLALLAALLVLSGCRVRTTARATLPAQESTMLTEVGGTGDGGEGLAGDRRTAAEAGAGDEAEAKTTENPEALRREYDENAAAEIAVGAEHRLHSEGEGSGTPASAEENSATIADHLHEQGTRTATQTVPADEADKMGVSDEAEAADSQLLYYTVLLEDRLSTLFECHRLNLYWETPAAYQTVFKASPEHQMILQAGCYDVSAKLLEENLTVDPGWVMRKNPGIVVKVVDQSVLGFGVTGSAASREVCGELCRRPEWSGIDAVREGCVLLLSEQLLTSQALRTAAQVCIAATAYPDLFEDVDVTEVVRALYREETGTISEAVLVYLKE